MNNKTITARVILKKGKEASIRRYHPWIFSGAIQSIEGSPVDGDWVNVVDTSGQGLGCGHYQKGSITVRVISFSNHVEGNHWQQKVQTAYQQRISCEVISPLTNAYRLIHGEGDGLPGLIVDIYNGVAVMQAHSIGMHRDRAEIAFALKEILGSSLSAVYYKSQSTLPLKMANEYLLGMAVVPHVIDEHGSKFFVDWEEGQKTGFFLDQRENRKRLAEISRDKTVLNTFSYTGGFSIYALSGGAKSVHSVDASERAVDLTRKNIVLNGFSAAENPGFAMDTFEFLKDKKDQYDLIILDPPAFAKHKEVKHQAMKGYQRLNAEAIRMVRSGGIILTFSCSQVVDRQLFYDTIVSAGIQAGREIKVLEHLGQPADHPVSLFHREGEYLKGLLLYVN
jgi:23S rRNA (cytosine1962-C5)-methyltransferase